MIIFLSSRSINYQPAISSVRNTLLDLSDNDSTQDYNVECVIDNTINRVIESYRNILNSELEEDEFDVPDATQDSHVEESAILSAITEHGLHNSSSGQVDDENDTFPADAQELDFLAEAAISSAIHSKGLSIGPSSLSSGKSSPQR